MLSSEKMKSLTIAINWIACFLCSTNLPKCAFANITLLCILKPVLQFLLVKSILYNTKC